MHIDRIDRFLLAASAIDNLIISGAEPLVAATWSIVWDGSIGAALLVQRGRDSLGALMGGVLFGAVAALHTGVFPVVSTYFLHPGRTWILGMPFLICAVIPRRRASR